LPDVGIAEKGSKPAQTGGKTVETDGKSFRPEDRSTRESSLLKMNKNTVGSSGGQADLLDHSIWRNLEFLVVRQYLSQVEQRTKEDRGREGLGLDQSRLRLEYERKFRTKLRLDEIHCRDLEEIINVFFGAKRKVNGRKELLRLYKEPLIELKIENQKTKITPKPDLIRKVKPALKPRSQAKSGPKKAPAQTAVWLATGRLF